MIKEKEYLNLITKLWQDNSILKNKLKKLEKENKELNEKLFGIDILE